MIVTIMKKSTTQQATKDKATMGKPWASAVKTAVSECLQEVEIKKAIIVVGLPEMKPGRNKTEHDKDKGQIDEMLTEIGFPGVSPANFIRLPRGKGGKEDDPRLMKLIMDTDLEQRLVLEARMKLSRSEKWKTVYLRPDLPLEVRREEAVLKRKIHLLNIQKNGNDYKVKLENGTATEKYGFRTIYGKATAVYYKKEDADDDWPNRGSPVKQTDLPDLPPDQ